MTPTRKEIIGPISEEGHMIKNLKTRIAATFREKNAGTAFGNYRPLSLVATRKKLWAARMTQRTETVGNRVTREMQNGRSQWYSCCASSKIIFGTLDEELNLRFSV